MSDPLCTGPMGPAAGGSSEALVEGGLGDPVGDGLGVSVGEGLGVSVSVGLGDPVG